MRRKDADEIAVLRRVIAAMEAAVRAAADGIRPGMTELQAYSFITGTVLDHLGEQASLRRLRLRSEAVRRGPTTARRIEKGEPFMLDYPSSSTASADFTNTWVVAGGAVAAPARARGVLQGGDGGWRAVACAGKPRPRGRRRASARLRQPRCGRPLSAPHGHGIGFGHPDPPYLTPGSDDVVAEGDVVTLEPGLYVEGVGGMRFERNYLITSTGFELLTRHRMGLE